MIKKTSVSSQQSLDRALELIEMLSKTGVAMNVAEISKTLGGYAYDYKFHASVSLTAQLY